jgi:hypothetical protein
MDAQANSAALESGRCVGAMLRRLRGVKTTALLIKGAAGNEAKTTTGDRGARVGTQEA